MKVFVVALFALVGFACAEYSQEVLPGNTAYGYLANIGIPEAERIRKAEEAGVESRIIGGLPVALGQYPFQAGIIISIVGATGMGVCGGSLLSNNVVLTAAHCWTDGTMQAWRFTIVLGSVRLFTGGHRADTSVVAMHNNWQPALARNDVAVAYLPAPVQFSATISPIALPSGAELQELFVGESVIATGFGLTGDDHQITTDQSMAQVRLNVIENNSCRWAFPLILQPTNICTSGTGGVGICRGDSGGPLIANRNGRSIVIGISSFGSLLGCESAMPNVFARVTSFVSFINQHVA